MLETHEPPPTEDMLPVPPETLSYGEITLRFAKVAPGEPSRGFVPYFHFRILTADGSDAGHINFRVGDTDHVRVCAGHIGFKIAEAFRGRRYALQACHAIAPFVRSIYRSVTITCDPDNLASRRTSVPPHRSKAAGEERNQERLCSAARPVTPGESRS